MKIVLATHNNAKIEELAKGLLESLPQATVITLSDLKIDVEPEETGNTFEENAELKARFYFEKTGIPTIADDGGIMIDALGGAPGVKSNRWLGRAATDRELIDYCLQQMKDIPAKKRTAKMGTCLCYFDGINTLYESDWNEGIISAQPHSPWQKGFPYRALFIIKKYNKYYDQLTDNEYQKINHRFKAVKRLVKKINSKYHGSI